MTWLRSNWRSILARLPLPSLALAAAYGVWRFQSLFTPWYVALISALSFELVYIGLAVVQLAPEDRRRATLISVGAVVVSVIYNSLSALFEIRPALLIDRPLWADVILAVAHGLPLAAVAFFVADLLLHTGAGPQTTHVVAPSPPQALPIGAAPQITPPDRRGHVYFLRSEHGYKIGKTTNLSVRMANIRSFLPFTVELVHTIQTDDMDRLEGGLHRVYADRCINGEWFALTRDDESLLMSAGNELAGDAIDSLVESAGMLAATTPLPDDLEEKKRLAVEMRRGRKSWREIANAVGRSPATVRGWLENHKGEDEVVT